MSNLDYLNLNTMKTTNTPLHNNTTNVINNNDSTSRKIYCNIDTLFAPEANNKNDQIDFDNMSNSSDSECSLIYARMKNKLLKDSSKAKPSSPKKEKPINNFVNKNNKFSFIHEAKSSHSSCYIYNKNAQTTVGNYTDTKQVGNVGGDEQQDGDGQEGCGAGLSGKPRLGFSYVSCPEYDFRCQQNSSHMHCSGMMNETMEIKKECSSLNANNDIQDTLLGKKRDFDQTYFANVEEDFDQEAIQNMSLDQ